jgi:hypothetical protein
MTSLLSRAIAAVRVWVGLNDPAENHLHSSHGWLLPPSGGVRARVIALAPALSPAPISSAPGKRR